ncbi:MAG TPA: hypothetical protein VGU66_13470 [Candidatus Elarobacter sp.]|nr:hypothetical protein [Candidatus Elarobacter sp.]
MSGVVVLVVVAVVATVWICWGYADAALSGWVEMGRRFRDPSPGVPNEMASASILIGPQRSHKAYVMIGVDDRGLHLRSRLVARPGHPPLLFPWDTVDSRGSFMWYRFWRYDTYGVGYYTTISIPARSQAAQLIAGFLQSRSLEVRHP